MEPNAIRTHVFSVIMHKIEAQDETKRREALAEFMSVTGTGGNATDKVVEMIPPLMGELYEKWVTMFVDRLMETVDLKNIELLCDGTDENNAALALAYIMFLESARMEKQIDQDLHEQGLSASGNNDMGDLAANYLRAQMAKIAQDTKMDKPKGNA
ncbi:hypothetical protein [Pseudodesulfovibrio sp.]|uniref:hypothetical protein n=1 Tax=unclassified Pseudodesulfovibrio TaxID=2661612 RepID=UPI003B002B85